jgi:hypothetical protein
VANSFGLGRPNGEGHIQLEDFPDSVVYVPWIFFAGEGRGGVLLWTSNNNAVSVAKVLLAEPASRRPIFCPAITENLEARAEAMGANQKNNLHA